MFVLGLYNTDRKSTKDKANISNPKVNSGCPPLTANRTSADCVQIALGPSMQYIPLRVYHTGVFNAVVKLLIWESVLITNQHETVDIETVPQQRVSWMHKLLWDFCFIVV